MGKRAAEGSPCLVRVTDDDVDELVPIARAVYIELLYEPNGEAHDLLRTRSTTLLYTARSAVRRNRRQDQHEVEHVVAQTRQRCGEESHVAPEELNTTQSTQEK